MEAIFKHTQNLSENLLLLLLLREYSLNLFYHLCVENGMDYLIQNGCLMKIEFTKCLEVMFHERESFI